MVAGMVAVSNPAVAYGMPVVPELETENAGDQAGAPGESGQSAAGENGQSLVGGNNLAPAGDIRTPAPAENAQPPSAPAQEIQPTAPVQEAQPTAPAEDIQQPTAPVQEAQPTAPAEDIQQPSAPAQEVQPTAPTENAQPSAAPVAGGGNSSGTSPVIEAGNGSGGSQGGAAGPGGAFPLPPTFTGPDTSAYVPGRVDYFYQPVANPVVNLAEKYTYDMMVQDLANLQARYGDSHMKINVIGTSLDGRNLYEAILGNPNAKKHVLIHAGIHAREYMNPLLVMKQLEYGLEYYDQGVYDGQYLKAILNNVAVHFVPMVNPDGILISQYGVDALQSQELKQVVRQCYEDDLAQGITSSAFERYLLYWKANARGVNLNGNFPANWDIVGSPSKPSFASYKGDSVLSEPESQALANLMNSREWAATVSYHSMGNIIYWDYEGNRVQQESNELATLIGNSTGYRLSGTVSHGGFKDWAQIKDNPVPSVTIETGGVTCPMPLSEYEDVWERNKMVWALVAKYAMEH